MEDTNIHIVLILTVDFIYASLLGYLTNKVQLSPILGYLLAGYLIGPYSPGFVADLQISEQLAEIGVILMMFGVGLHFKWRELASVKNIAIPGAIGQTLVATIAGTLLLVFLGWSLVSGLVIGMAIGVASTVVLVRVLADNNLLTTQQGHIAVGWLIVEDLITVFVLLLLPTLASDGGPESFTLMNLTESFAIAILKCIALVVVIYTVGLKAVSYIFFKVARTRSQELFTLTVLAITFGIATGSAVLFGTSIALGAFIAGMMIGQTEVRHQALAHALPLKDAFAVIFFLAVGMLFNPQVIADHFLLFIGILGIILLIKPLVALLIVIGLHYPVKTGIIVAVALAQIGEFSFILAEQSMQLNLIPDEGYDVIVACALVSIAINPLFFKLGLKFAKIAPEAAPKSHKLLHKEPVSRRAIVVGYGPIGHAVSEILKQLGYTPTIIDSNLDTIAGLESKGNAIFGDATTESILTAAKIHLADLLVITIPDGATSLACVKMARENNPKIKIFARANYLSDKHILKEQGVHVISSEEVTQQAFLEALWKTSGSVLKQYES